MSSRPGDPPLSDLGFIQARDTGGFLNYFLTKRKIRSCDVVVLSSPFLRSIQTANEIMTQFTIPDADDLSIKVEPSLWKLDDCNGQIHSYLPSLDERTYYFHRIDTCYKISFVPTLPEQFPAQFIHRCKLAMKSLTRRYRFRRNSTILVVTHASCCIAMVAAATGLHLSEINPAGACSIFRLTRNNSSDRWILDRSDEYVSGGFNGYQGHVNKTSNSTFPWHRLDANECFTGPLQFAKEDEGYTRKKRVNQSIY